MEILKIPIEHYAVCWSGAIVLYFKLRSDGRSVMEFLPHINPKWKKSVGLRIIDILLFSLVGALIGTIFTEPTTPQQALAAGLGWTGLLSAVAKTGGTND